MSMPLPDAPAEITPTDTPAMTLVIWSVRRGVTESSSPVVE